MRTAIHKRFVHALEKIGFKRCKWNEFDYDILKYIMIRKRAGASKRTYADMIMMADTETSRKMENPGDDPLQHHNHVCAWSIAIRAYHMNICVLWGKKPSDLPECLQRIRDKLLCDDIFLYWHNMPYDWVFCRKFLMEKFDKPDKQLNVKPLYPLQIRFSNGIVMKDSLMLAQRSLEKWGKDLHVEHAKAVGKWNYDLIRDFDSWDPDPDELDYMSNDVLCGVECIDKTCEALHKTIGSIPLTATGIVRGEARLAGSEFKAYEWSTGILPESYEEMLIQEEIFHGGYTHGDRFANGNTFPGFLDDSPIIEAYDIASSYPYVMISEKMPAERFYYLKERQWTKDYIINNADTYAFIFKLCISKVRLKDPRFPMPTLSLSKCEIDINSIVDNGRIIKSDYVEIRMNEIDFLLFDSIYKCSKMIISEVQCAVKEYLPRWLRDYVYKRFILKTQLKGVDPVLYAIEKAKLNSIFGMAAQKTVKEDILEDYDSGEFAPLKFESDAEQYEYLEREYAKYLKNRNTFLPYCIGIWVTSAGMRNLFELGSCRSKGSVWLYSDTDSVYATSFDKSKIKAYNKRRIDMLTAAGYGPVHWNNRDYWLGIAEEDGKHMQFKALHAKCYVKRPLVAEGDNFIMGDNLKITIAGVPKKGAAALQNNIDNFHIGSLFPGTISGKLQHTHYFIDEIYVDEHGNETGDSIELSPCDYIIKDPDEVDFESIVQDQIREEIEMIGYEDGEDGDMIEE